MISQSTVLTDGRHRRMDQVECMACGAVCRSAHATSDTARIAKNFTNRGWDVGPRRTLCPDCQNQKKGERSQMTKTVTSQTKPVPVHAIQAVRNATAREVVRIADKLAEVMAAPDRYKSGWSDRRVGEDIDLPAALIAKVREDLNGPLGEDPEITVIIAEIKALEQCVFDLKARVLRATGVQA